MVWVHQILVANISYPVCYRNRYLKVFIDIVVEIVLSLNSDTEEVTYYFSSNCVLLLKYVGFLLI